jgi:hypothetical protein
MAIAVIITLLASVLEVISPLVMGHAHQPGRAQRRRRGRFRHGAALAVLRSHPALPRRRLAAGARLAVRAGQPGCAACGSVDAFGHSLGLSLNFHQTRRTRRPEPHHRTRGRGNRLPHPLSRLQYRADPDPPGSGLDRARRRLRHPPVDDRRRHHCGLCGGHRDHHRMAGSPAAEDERGPTRISARPPSTS